jgi:hypothetical protein
MNIEQNYNQNQTEVQTKKRGTYKKKITYTSLKEFEIETELLNKIISIQRMENKKNILNGVPEITIKELVNKYLRLGFAAKID